MHGVGGVGWLAGLLATGLIQQKISFLLSHPFSWIFREERRTMIWYYGKRGKKVTTSIIHSANIHCSPGLCWTFIIGCWGYNIPGLQFLSPRITLLSNKYYICFSDSRYWTMSHSLDFKILSIKRWSNLLLITSQDASIVLCTYQYSIFRLNKWIHICYHSLIPPSLCYEVGNKGEFNNYLDFKLYCYEQKTLERKFR